MKTLVKYIAAAAMASTLAATAGIAYAQTTPDAKTATTPDAKTATTPDAKTATTPDAKTATAPNEQAKPKRDHAKWEARQAKMIDKLFAKFDPQKTGTITVEAFLKGADDRFDKIDTKHQGFIDKDELATYMGTGRAEVADRVMKRLDTNADGKITKDEFEKPLRKRFALLDLNDDGKVTREEADLAGPASMVMPHHGRAHNHMRDHKGTTQQ